MAYTSPARGNLHPIVPALIELSRRGHQVHVATARSEAAVRAAAGLNPRPIAAAIDAVDRRMSYRFQP